MAIANTLRKISSDMNYTQPNSASELEMINKCEKGF